MNFFLKAAGNSLVINPSGYWKPIHRHLAAFRNSIVIGVSAFGKI
jgi:hypothetical protein